MESPENYYASLVQNQEIAIVPSITLESGVILHDVPIAYSTWGLLNEDRDNVLVVCHALTGSSDALDWWRPLMGPGKALDFTRYFVFCANVLGSPYGSASPLSTNPFTGKPFGPTFPATTIRDDVRVHKLVLDTLGVRSVAAVIGGSMGGMHTLEWSLCSPSKYVKNIVLIATSPYQGAWGISWGETQRQAIYADTTFENGWYHPTPQGQPRRGLGTARMIGLLTYRSFASFEARFGRRSAAPKCRAIDITELPTPPPSDSESTSSEITEMGKVTPVAKFSAQSYLDYQANKFLERFDANCYIHLTKKMDTHDITRGRDRFEDKTQRPSHEDLKHVLATIPNGALVIGVESDLLFPLQQQIELKESLPHAEFIALQSTDGHDGFLLEFKRLDSILRQHLEKRCAWIYEGAANMAALQNESITTSSVFGELESD